MSDGDLRKRRFTSHDVKLDAVRRFTCGTEDWETEVSDWIKGPALDDMTRGCQVWLYFIRRSERNHLVGFGSLGEPPWKYPPSTDLHPNIIPNVAVALRFQGKPAGPWEERYAYLIMSDLISEAVAHAERSPLLMLYVHPQNHRAIRFYEKIGFEPFHKVYRDKVKGVDYRSMILDLAAMRP
jgi:RimJ/RimL family protein N-acetyltransferase